MNKIDEVKSAALKLFAAKGYAATSMQDIADAVGLNKASLYFYTRSKKELYLTIVKEQLYLVSIAIETIFDSFIDQPVPTLLYQVFKSVIHRPTTEWILLWKRMNIKLAGETNDEMIQPLREIIQSFNQSITNIATKYIEKKKFVVEEVILNRFIVAYETFIEGVFDWRLLNPNVDIDYVLQVIWNAFWNGSQTIFTAKDKPSDTEE